ncbi:outer membrane beta-barrel protein [Flavihumibacter profundi]|jgi:hypothetical protein|uniref:outer membrane beta-barrel protein n=1 Tax=Flavihumibacter profundi TaxID=2716883 RepID=UPI001CC6DDC2|nr:outer membrane beta-barrel protein [Flavihumibacter profundi]MBZ5857930.1 PorT family protein [Flavihumibacter profundi]
MLKKISLLALVTISGINLMAQTDTTKKTPQNTGDTMRIGNIIILKNGGAGTTGTTYSDWDINIYRHNPGKPKNLSTSWLIFDFGFNNFTDNTNYSSADVAVYAPGSNADWFGLRNNKSVNVNLWIFMQRLNIYKHVVNLKYGAGFEWYNFRFDDNIRYYKNPPRIEMDTVITYSKNKLATDYVTIPLMLNFNFTPNNPEYKSFGISAGISAGYLYNSRNKYISDETGKQKTKGDLGLEDFKLAYIAEVQLGPIKLYGSYATQTMYKKGLDHTPYAVGLRLSHW